MYHIVNRKAPISILYDMLGLNIFSQSHEKKSCLSKESYLYFIPVLIYTPNKVKSEQREEKRWLRQADQPIYLSPHTTQPIFLLAAKIFVTASCFQLTSVGEITAYFVSSQRIENRWTSDGETAVFPLVPIQEKERRNGRF